jgi:DNA-directed RNA polymerase specialized sigma24 family protein
MFSRIWPHLVAWLRPVVGDEAEDAASFAFLQLCRHRRRLSEGNIEGWVFTVARHRAFTLRRHREVPSESVRATHDDGGFELVEAMDALSHLGSFQQTALMCRMLGLSYEQACEATGRSYTWVNRHTSEGRAALRGSEAAA